MTDGTFRELLIEFNTRRTKRLIGMMDPAISDLQWAIQSILERLANWEEFRDNHPSPKDQ